MKVQEAINRGLNFFATAFLAIMGITTLDEIVSEDEWTDKIDDAVLMGIAAAAVVWYLRGRNRYARSLVPLVLMVLGAATKALGLWIEHDDTQAVGPDIGVVIYLTVATIVFGWQLYATRKGQPS